MADILLAGVGGQGAVLASKVLAGCAMKKGLAVKTAETIGMAQRGGCVVSHVRTGKQVFSPLIPLSCADVIIAFEPAEAARALPYLKRGGTVIVNTAAVQPVTATLSGGGYDVSSVLDFLKSQNCRVATVDCTKAVRECGAKTINFCLLGAACALDAIGFTQQELFDIIDSDIPPKFREINKKAALTGAQSIE